MRKRQLETGLWYDEKIQRCTWLETVVFVHLLVRRELTTFGVIHTTPDSVARLLNGITGKNVVTPELPLLTPKHVEAALRNLARRRLLAVDNGLDWCIYFRNFLKYQNWGPSVTKSWPMQLREVPSTRIRNQAARACRDYCKSRGYEVPKGL